MMDKKSVDLDLQSFQSNPDTNHLCTCGSRCLGPLTFHPEVKGQNVKLSEGGRRASRTPGSFNHGVTFSSRPLRVGEKVHMRVERCVSAWHGAIRLGFTHVPPGSGPVCSLAIPDLTDRPGYWATLVPENHCFPRSELMFWVTRTGRLRIQTQDGFVYKEKMLLMDTRKPIWAMIDVYGQTSAVLLLGSEKKTLFSKRHSCSAPKISASEKNCGYDQLPEVILKKMNRRSLDGNPPLCQRKTENEESCVVCYSDAASVRLDCGHSCLCSQCAVRIIRDFGTCPLCRQCIDS